jgi:preprotein translocase subunit Sec61beta
MEKWNSRKLWMVAVAGILFALNKRLGIGLTPDTMLAIGALVGIYVVGNVAQKAVAKK